MAVLWHAPELVSDAERTASLVQALEGAEIYGGLTQTLRQIESFHPPEIVAALLRGVLTRAGGNAVHFVAMIMFIHGKAKSSFDWDQRPFFLEFSLPDGANAARSSAIFAQGLAWRRSPTCNRAAALFRQPRDLKQHEKSALRAAVAVFRVELLVERVVARAIAATAQRHRRDAEADRYV